MLPTIGRLRSRSASEKAARRSAILAAALAACARSSFAGMRMAEVAADAGIAKGTLFAYFPTREELALALLREHLERWCDDLERRLHRLPGPPAPPILARVLAASLAGRTGLLELAPLAGGMLTATGADAAATFRSAWAAGLDRAGAAVGRAAPALGPGGGDRVVRHAVALAPGLRDPLIAIGASPVDELRWALEAHIVGVRARAPG
jgi:AcrR family transcriptional regulator